MKESINKYYIKTKFFLFENINHRGIAKKNKTIFKLSNINLKKSFDIKTRLFNKHYLELDSKNYNNKIY